MKRSHLQPGERTYLSEEQFDAACRAIADFVDIKLPYTLGHSSGVAELAAAAASRCGLPEADVVAIRRAGWLHDVGRTGVSAGLTAREIEVLRLVTQELTTTHIAEQLMISPRTADAHVRSIYRKLEVTSRAAATRAAIEHQLI
jgi:DNA-binding CsgD family transcriptional regulator